MIVGAAVVELHVHDSQSLKSKRGVVRSIAQRVRNRFPIAIAEVGGQNTWQRAVLGLSTVGIDHGRVRTVLEQAVAFVEGLGLAEVVGSDVELLTLPFESASGADLDDATDRVIEDEDESA
jgi:uncharacterized protein YlxP (DUF503 family)